VTPEPGWTFQEWSGDLTGNTNPTSITMYHNKNITATITQDHYTLEVNVEGSGTVTTNPTQTFYVYGDIVSLTAVRSLGWNFIGWSGDLSSTDNPASIVIDSSKKITLTFTEKQYTWPVTVFGTLVGYMLREAMFFFLTIVHLFLLILAQFARAEYYVS